jgi:hypothetical protein
MMLDTNNNKVVLMLEDENGEAVAYELLDVVEYNQAAFGIFMEAEEDEGDVAILRLVGADDILCLHRVAHMEAGLFHQSQHGDLGAMDAQMVHDGNNVLNDLFPLPFGGLDEHGHIGQSQNLVIISDLHQSHFAHQTG